MGAARGISDWGRASRSSATRSIASLEQARSRWKKQPDAPVDGWSERAIASLLAQVAARATLNKFPGSS